MHNLRPLLPTLTLLLACQPDAGQIEPSTESAEGSASDASSEPTDTAPYADDDNCIDERKPRLWSTDFSAQTYSLTAHVRELGDVNGDGILDIIGFHDAGVWVALGSLDPFGAGASMLWSDSFRSDESGGWGDPAYVRRTVDLKSDGVTDIIGFGNNGTYWGTSNGVDGFVVMPALKEFDLLRGWDAPADVRTLGDIDGDGYPDIVGFKMDMPSPMDQNVFVSLGTPDGQFTPIRDEWRYWFGAGGKGTDPKWIGMGDTNADGQDDMISFATTWYGWIPSPAGGFATSQPAASTALYDLGLQNPDYTVRIAADIDADDRVDVVAFGLDRVVVSLGSSGYQQLDIWYEDMVTETGWSVDRHERMLGDVNGDGYLDLVGFGEDGVTIALRDPETPHFVASGCPLPQFGYSQETGGWRKDRHIRTVADVDGDGSDDLIGFGEYGVHVIMN